MPQRKLWSQKIQRWCHRSPSAPLTREFWVQPARSPPLPPFALSWRSLGVLFSAPCVPCALRGEAFLRLPWRSWRSRRFRFFNQSSEQAPGPRGSPHMPHAPPDISGTDFAAPKAVGTLALNTESCFSTFVLLHDGHSTVLPLRTRVSKRLSHFPHTYSNIGISSPRASIHGIAYHARYQCHFAQSPVRYVPRKQ